MKKKYLILAGLLLGVAAVAGCGKKSTDDGKQSETQVTVAPATDNQKTDSSSGSDTGLVDMEKSADEDITNIMGEKTSTSSKVVLINKTGSEIASIYIRPNSDDENNDEWGDDLVNGMFTLKDGDKALYYFEKNAKDSSGNAVSSYDIRISYTDENKSECFFRKIPLQNISQITLKMDGSGDSSIPYATYLTGSSKKETSTLTEVKKRLGLIDDNGDSTDNSNSDNTSSTPAPAATSAPSVTSAPTPTPDPGNTDPSDSGASVAEKYIGQSLDSLIAACGEPQGSDYQNEPETGETGYHYYPSFTVSTTVDESGNEIVAGVW